MYIGTRCESNFEDTTKRQLTSQIATDFAQNGVDVTMLQRTPTFIMSVDKGQGMMVAPLYNDKMTSVDFQDRLGESNPKFVVKLHHKRIVRNLQVADRELLDGLEAKGFKHWSGPEGSGFIMSACIRCL